MDAEVTEALAPMRPAAKLNVLTRHGSPVELANADRAAAGTAKRIVLLHPPGTSEEALRQSTGLLQASTQLHTHHTRDSTQVPHMRSVCWRAGVLQALQAGVHKQPSKRADVVVAAPPGYKYAAGSDAFGSYAEVTRPICPRPRACPLPCPRAHARRAALCVRSSRGHGPRARACGQVTADDFVSRVLAQCTAQPGLSHVYDELLLQVIAP